MKTIDVKKQPRLTLRRTFEITMNGVRYRLFRSTITVTVIAVAIAFMMNILCEAMSTHAVARYARRQTAEQRLATAWATRLTVLSTPDEILQEIAGAERPICEEAARQGNLSPAALQSYVTSARAAQSYLTLFSQMDYLNRRLLFAHAEDSGIFDYLRDPEAFRAFTTQILAMKSFRLPGGLDSFRTFLQAWPSVKARTLAIRQGRQRAIATLQQMLHGGSIIDLLADATDETGTRIAQAGFTAFDASVRQQVAPQAKMMQEMTLLESALDKQYSHDGAMISLRQRVAAQAEIFPGDLTPAYFWQMLRNAETARWYLTALHAAGLPTRTLTPARILLLARHRAGELALERAIQLTPETQGGLLGIGSRMTWLVLVSMLVCVVGISNAMLMSVTERFREIATLKCLGGLDGFIMSLFVIEAGVFGLAGGVLGALGGSLIGFGRMFATFGGLMLQSFSLASWLLALLLSCIFGIVLAALAGVYPSYVAARLAPMEAMRIE